MSVDLTPDSYPLIIVRGDDLLISVRILDDDNVTPLDISAWTGAAMIRSTTGSVPSAAVVDLLTLGASGYALLRWPRAGTETLTAGAATWDLELIDTADRKTTPVGGPVTVLQDTTY